MENEKIQLDYLHNIDYNNTPENQVGSGTQTGLRTIPTPGGAVYYVRKFGTPYLIKNCTNLEQPVNANCKVSLYALDGTLLGHRTGGGAYNNGATLGAAQGCYLTFEALGADITLNTWAGNYNIDTDVDPAGRDFIIPAEIVYAGDTRIVYLSDTGSCYYNSTMTLGGGRHTPVAGNSRKPFFHIYDPLNDGGWGNDDGIEIVDNETYSFPYKDDGGTWRYEFPLSVTPCYVYSSDGKEPKIKSIIGADIEHEVSGLFNNETAVFFNENGTNVDTAATGYEDTWHDPYGTITNAKTAATAKGITNIIYGGTGATENSTIEGNFSITGNNAILEPEYGYIPVIGGGLNHSAGNEIIGFSVNGGYIKDYGIDGSGDTYNCTAYNCEHSGIFNCGNNVINCKCYNNNSHGIHTSVGGAETVTLNIKNCLVFNNATDGIKLFITGGFGTATLTAILENNIIYNNQRGVFAENAMANTLNVTFNQNICFENTNNGFELTSPNTLTSNNCIYYGNGNYGIFSNNAKTIGFCDFFNNGTNYNVNITSNNEILTDPQFCSIISPYYFGLQTTSPCYRSGSDSDDIGIRLRTIEINADDIEINGIQIDGNSQFNNAIYIKDTAHHKDCIIKWCNIFDFRGIGIDVYDNADTDWVISNNKIYNNGIGIKLLRGGNTLEENIIYNNLFEGVWLDYTIQIFNHNVFFRNKYGLYLESNCGGILLKNCIFNQNSSYEIYSEVNIIINSCCIIDNYTNNVDVTSNSNITDNPLFINTLAGSENFNLKTFESGYGYNSFCKNASDDTSFPDIGAYDILRSVAEDQWKTHVLTYNPKLLPENLIGKGIKTFENIFGGKDNWGKDFKRTFDLKYSKNQFMDEMDRKKLFYFLTLIQKRENNLSEEETIIRAHFLKYQHEDTGTNAVINATTKTLTDTTKTWIEDEHRGFNASIHFDSNTGNMNIVAATRICTVPAAGWTVDEWIGYYLCIYINSTRYYFYILDNDATTVTVSDPNGYLTNQANIDWQIVKNFLIENHDETILTLTDDDSELVTGTYDYHIGFIRTKIDSKKIRYTQSRYYRQKENWKTGINLKLQQE